MKAMRYMINLEKGKIPELSVFVENYQKRQIFVFINQIDGSFILDLETGKKRLDLVDKDTTEVFDINVDSNTVLDLIDSLNNVYNDTKALMKRYFHRPPAKKEAGDK